tara:strand:- start:16090 stop:16221 length:132 start_codon:yes stop_codon:yes gene_type:complete
VFIINLADESSNIYRNFGEAKELANSPKKDSFSDSVEAMLRWM